MPIAGPETIVYVGSEYFATLPIGRISPDPLNPRKTIDIDDTFRDSIAGGIIEPLIVRPDPAKPQLVDTAGPCDFLLVAGERRYTAAVELELETVPAIVRYDLEDNAAALECMLTENGQRADLTPLDEAAAYAKLVELGRSQRDIAKRVGREQGTVSKRLSLLKLPERAQALLREKTISVQTALGMTGLIKDNGRLSKVLDYASQGGRADPDIASFVFRELDDVKRIKERAKAEKERDAEKATKRESSTAPDHLDLPADKPKAENTNAAGVDPLRPAAESIIAEAALDFVAARHELHHDTQNMEAVIAVDSAWEHLRLACGYSHSDFDGDGPISADLKSRSLTPFPAWTAGDSSVWQCAQCGCLVDIAGATKPGDCPNPKCDKRPTQWWEQTCPVGPFGDDEDDIEERAPQPPLVENVADIATLTEVHDAPADEIEKHGIEAALGETVELNEPAEPWKGYQGFPPKSICNIIAKRTTIEELTAVIDYETANAGRPQILDAARAQLDTITANAS